MQMTADVQVNELHVNNWKHLSMCWKWKYLLLVYVDLWPNDHEIVLQNCMTQSGFMQASEDLPFCALEESFPSCTCLPQNIVSFSVNLDGLPEKLKGCLGSLGTLCIHIPFVLLVCIGMYFVLLVLACSCFVLTVGS